MPVRLVVFPEFAHAAPVFPTVAELRGKLAVKIPNEHTERLEAKAREHGIYMQTGSMLEEDPKWPGHVFNTTCLIGPDGILYKYRKVNTWIPYEVHTSPPDLPDYNEPLFPVADTPIGRIGCAICYDWLFPEAIRQLTANGAEVLVRVSAYMDPWGATEPMDWWTVINRARAIENLAMVVAANQGASLKFYPPYSWPGGSRLSTSTVACWPRLHLVRAKGLSWRRSTSRRCVTSAPRASGITCWRICAPRPTRSTRLLCTRPAGGPTPTCRTRRISVASPTQRTKSCGALEVNPE